jgi:hypothetical protein
MTVSATGIEFVFVERGDADADQPQPNADRSAMNGELSGEDHCAALLPYLGRLGVVNRA